VKLRTLGLGEFRRAGGDGTDKKEVFVAGAATVVALFHFLKQGVPGGFGKNLGSLPFLGVLEFPLPGDFAGKQGDPINHGGLVAARFFRPFDGPAHGRSD